jgi:hypothetical protein
MVALCLTSEDFHISKNNTCPAFAGTGVLVCGQSMIYHYFNLFKEDYYV